MTTAAPTPDLDEFRAWLADGAAAKAVVRARVAATVVESATGPGARRRHRPGRDVAPFLADKARTAAIDDATAAVLRAIDLPGLERQAVAATRARARAKGTGPMGRLTSLIYRASGRDTKVADPTGHLLRWRERAPLSPAVESFADRVGCCAHRAPARPSGPPSPRRWSRSRCARGWSAPSTGRSPAWTASSRRPADGGGSSVCSRRWRRSPSPSRPPGSWSGSWPGPSSTAVDVPIIGAVPMPFACCW